MEDPQLYISGFGDEEDDEDQQETDMDMAEPFTPDPHEDFDLGSNSFPCQHCERHFASKQGLERHMHIHNTANYSNKSYSLKTGHIPEANVNAWPVSLSPQFSTETVRVEPSSSLSCSGASILTGEGQIPVLDSHSEVEGGHACKYCEKVFSTHINKRRHERRIHEHPQRLKAVEKDNVAQEENPQSLSSTRSQQETQLMDNTTPVAVPLNEGVQAEQYMLDISSNISENLSFYIDGKIVSTSTVTSCEVVETNAGTATLVGLDTFILDPAQISHALNVEGVEGKEMPAQLVAKRRTATPPLLPQIKTELESEVVVPSSSSSTLLVSSLIENLLPQSVESTAMQKERTVFLSPKLKQLLEKQEGLNPTFAFITDGQKLCSPLALSVLSAGTGRFKRRTASPTRSPQQNPTLNVENTIPDTVEANAVNTVQIEIPHSSPAHNISEEEECLNPPIEETEMTDVLPDSWPPVIGGNSCNQQPLDLSNAVKRNDDVALAETVLDLSLQRKSTEDPLSLVTQPALFRKKKPNTCMLEKVLMNEYANADVGQQNVSVFGNPENALSDFAIVAGSDIMTPTEGLVCGLTLPSTSLAPLPPSLTPTLTPVALQPAPSCTIALTSPVSHTMLPTAPSLITVLAQPSPINNQSNQAVQVLAPNISPEPLVICTDNTLNPSASNLTTAFTANAANLIALSQPLDPALNLPGHVFLTDQIALNAPMIESSIGSEVPFSSTVSLNNPLINSYNITSNTVWIECTVALDAPGNVVPTAITFQENTVEPPEPTQMVIDHIEQQQMVSLPTPEMKDPNIIVSSSVAESVTLSNTSVTPDSSTVKESNEDSDETTNAAEEQSSPEEEQSSPEEEQSSPEEEQSSPEEEPLTPDVEPLTPDVEPLTPDVEPLTPEVEPLTPDVEPLTPDIEPLTPDVEHSTLDVEQSTPDVEKSIPDVEPSTPDVEQSTPDIERSTPKEVQPTPEEEEPPDSCVPSDIAISDTEISPPSEVAEVGESTDDTDDDTLNEAEPQTFTKNFVCNVCDKLFHSMKGLGHHVSDHADEWPYKCEFCVLLFGKPASLLEHRSTLHGVGKTYVCSACTKEFVYLCNLKHHQEELHPGQQCTHTEEEKGKLRPQNYNHSAKDSTKTPVHYPSKVSKKDVKKEEVDHNGEELFTTIKIMASDEVEIKGPDVRLGINQHYPSFKPPPFPYHNRSPAGSVASATNFTTHNIPQTFSTAIRCTKCGKSFDNMPELHKHILACANASDKRRYTPKKNPIPLRHFAKAQNGVLSTTNATNAVNDSHRSSQANRSKANQDPPVNMRLSTLNKRKKKLAQRAMSQRNKSVSSSNKATAEQETFGCLHCTREFTMRRSRTKHMAVCPKKPKEVKKRNEERVSVTKENNGHLHRGVTHLEEKRHASAQDQKTRVQTSNSAKRPAVLPVQTVLSNKKSKIIIKESVQPQQEMLGELPVGRTFNPSMRQYRRVQHGVKEAPIKISIVKPHGSQPERKKGDLPPIQSCQGGNEVIPSSLQQRAPASVKEKRNIQQPPRQGQDPVV